MGSAPARKVAMPPFHGPFSPEPTYGLLTMVIKTEVNIIRACIRQGQRFVIVRSRSDELIARIADGDNDDLSGAKETHLVSTLMDIRDELERSGASKEVLEDLAETLVLVNKNDLRRLAWGGPKGVAGTGGRVDAGEDALRS